jgi:hypothetical protein
VPVTQPVEDQFDQFPGGSDLADAGSAALSDLVTEAPQAGVAADALNGLHRGPAHQLAALFSDPAPMDRGVRLVMSGGPGLERIGPGSGGSVRLRR